jgi:hypothetical protein
LKNYIYGCLFRNYSICNWNGQEKGNDYEN